MKASQIISLASLVFGTQALVAAPRDAGYSTNAEVKREAEAAPVAEPDFGLCAIGRGGPCNDDEADDIETDDNEPDDNEPEEKDWWEKYREFRAGRDVKREAAAEAAPVAAPVADPLVYGICMVGVKSPCNGDAVDGDDDDDSDVLDIYQRFQKWRGEKARD